MHVCIKKYGTKVAHEGDGAVCDRVINETFFALL